MRSPSAANGSSSTTIASWYALMTHTDSAGLTPNCRAIAGSAMLATAESSTAIVTAMAIANIAHWRCGVGSPSGWIVWFRRRLRRWRVGRRA